MWSCGVSLGQGCSPADGRVCAVSHPADADTKRCTSPIDRGAGLACGLPRKGSMRAVAQAGGPPSAQLRSASTTGTSTIKIDKPMKAVKADIEAALNRQAARDPKKTPVQFRPAATRCGGDRDDDRKSKQRGRRQQSRRRELAHGLASAGKRKRRSPELAATVQVLSLRSRRPCATAPRRGSGRSSTVGGAEPCELATPSANAEFRGNQHAEKTLARADPNVSPRPTAPSHA